jgi:DNA-binding HxlR family transcriptional regulator
VQTRPDPAVTETVGPKPPGAEPAGPKPAVLARTAALPGRPCAIAATLRLVGDKWTLLVVRELLFGNRRFDRLVTNTGAPRDRLAARLRDLEAADLVVRRRYQERPERFEYHLTAAGRELGPVLQALRAWGDRWAVPRPPMVFRHRCGHEVVGSAPCPGCGERVGADMVIESLTPGWDLSGPAGRADGGG